MPRLYGKMGEGKGRGRGLVHSIIVIELTRSEVGVHARVWCGGCVTGFFVLLSRTPSTRTTPRERPFHALKLAANSMSCCHVSAFWSCVYGESCQRCCSEPSPPVRSAYTKLLLIK